ncbi:hypothetical protein LTR29_007045 [Friedmanniomyces endolithicus]|nr:hypothetical protein LTR29_007045 [Friedmanniomyces endolithicus]
MFASRPTPNETGSIYPRSKSTSPTSTRSPRIELVSSIERSRSNLQARHFEASLPRHPNLLKQYSRLPFATRLVFEEIQVNVNLMNLTIIPWHEVEQQSKPVGYLQKLWEREIQPESWPEVITLGSLRLVRQLHDSISVVSLASSPEYLYAFKSTVENLVYVYHELKFLLAAPPHPNVMPRPEYIVTQRCAFGGKQGVVGFLLPYYPMGAIRDILPARVRADALPVTQKIKWCIQVTKALIHVHEQGGAFYSDLRPDNVLLAAFTNAEGQRMERIVLCDFEQRGNWHEWCPPEILHRQHAENIRACETVLPARWQRLIDAYRPANPSPPPSFVESKNLAWFSLSPTAQDKAMAFSLGLFIYCVFEGLSNVRVNIANAYSHDPDIEFPNFRRTPAAVQTLIHQCTADAPEWPENAHVLSPPRAARVIRIRDRLYGARYQASGCTVDVVEDVLQTGLRWWATEMERAESFLDSEAWRSQDFGCERPSLRSVLSSLEEIEASLQGQS